MALKKIKSSTGRLTIQVDSAIIDKVDDLKRRALMLGQRYDYSDELVAALKRDIERTDKAIAEIEGNAGHKLTEIHHVAKDVEAVGVMPVAKANVPWA
jgi:hypothetical protein